MKATLTQGVAFLCDNEPDTFGLASGMSYSARLRKVSNCLQNKPVGVTMLSVLDGDFLAVVKDAFIGDRSGESLVLP